MTDRPPPIGETYDRGAGSGKATWSLVLSLVAHLAVVGGVSWVAYRTLAEKAANEAAAQSVDAGSNVIAVDLPSVAEGSLTSDREVIPEGTEPSQLGGATVARVDTGSPGAGGDATGARATNLAAMAENVKLDPDLLSRLDRDQIQRLRTAQLRTTHEDRRSTTRPMELTFLASGKGELAERRPDSRFDPSRGSIVADAPSVVGGQVGATPDDESERDRGTPVGADRAGQLVASPGVGVRNARAGADHRNAARIAFARPSVAEGSPTIPGIWNGRPNDTVDSDQEVASRIRSLVHASVAGGLPGEGRGGSGAGTPDPGAGGGPTGRGSVARPMGTGDGDLVDWNTTDPRLVAYLRKLHAKVNPFLAKAFPESARLEQKQGTVILEFTIATDGTVQVAWPPARRSGIDEYDRNCADAIRRAGPFEPLPAALREDGRTTLRIRAPFVARNPLVH